MCGQCVIALRWRHNDHPAVSSHQPHGCLLNRLFRRRWKKTSKLRVTVLCAGNSPGPGNSPHKGPVMRKMFPFDDVIMWTTRDLLVDPLDMNNTHRRSMNKTSHQTTYPVNSQWRPVMEPRNKPLLYDYKLSIAGSSCNGYFVNLAGVPAIVLS